MRDRGIGAVIEHGSLSPNRQLLPGDLVYRFVATKITTGSHSFREDKIFVAIIAVENTFSAWYGLTNLDPENVPLFGRQLKYQNEQYAAEEVFNNLTGAGYKFKPV